MIRLSSVLRGEQNGGHAVDSAALANALTRIPERQQRLLLMLVADREPSYDEISRTLGMPLGSLGPTRARALARLLRDSELVGVVR